MKPVVSVLIPVYNVEEYLPRCLESIMGQTLKNLEIICVNDGSTDNSGKILEEYAKKDPRIIVVTKENGGLPSARNAGLERASGEYVGFVDSDDYAEPKMYETLVNAAKKDNSEIAICGANIFPESPKADKWLYDTLSPQAAHYKEYSPEVIFDRGDTTPFLWRILAKKSLIDEYDLRLDESIVLGEDKAFQEKLYSRAKGITVIPDKLYNYCWFRPGSLMSTQVYGKNSRKVSLHTRLIAGVYEDLASQNMKKEQKENTELSFLNWSLPFIYNDFMSLPLAEKTDLSQSLVSLWERAGYYRHLRNLPEWKRSAFEYIKSFLKIPAPGKNPRLSFISTAEGSSRYIDEWIFNINSLSGPDTEFIIINNGSSNENYLKIQDLLYKNPCVRLFNTPCHYSYGDCLNSGVNLASGTYITFLETQDWYESEKNLSEWLLGAENKNADICVCPLSRKNLPCDKTSEEIGAAAGGFNALLELDFHDALYKRSFLVENELTFPDASIMTGYVFYCRALFAADKIACFDKKAYIIRHMYHPDWISTKKCSLVLNALEEIEDISLKNRNAVLHAKVFSLLNGNMLKQMIVNNTKPYCMPSSECPNGENSQIESILPVFSILSKADQDLLYEAGCTDKDSILDIAYEMVMERQNFLNRMP